jgi:hypothetical protein
MNQHDVLTTICGDFLSKSTEYVRHTFTIDERQVNVENTQWTVGFILFDRNSPTRLSLVERE